MIKSSSLIYLIVGNFCDNLISRFLKGDISRYLFKPAFFFASLNFRDLKKSRKTRIIGVAKMSCNKLAVILLVGHCIKEWSMRFKIRWNYSAQSSLGAMLLLITFQRPKIPLRFPNSAVSTMTWSVYDNYHIISLSLLMSTMSCVKGPIPPPVRLPLIYSVHLTNSRQCFKCLSSYWWWLSS